MEARDQGEQAADLYAAHLLVMKAERVYATARVERDRALEQYRLLAKAFKPVGRNIPVRMFKVDTETVLAATYHEVVGGDETRFEFHDLVLLAGRGFA